MSKAFSVASWNVEHFKDDTTRINRVVKFLKNQTPDVFGLYEVEGKSVFASMVSQLPSYQFHITEGPQTQEILVGIRKGLTAFFTQKVEFKAGNPGLRPGALLTLTIDGRNYTLLFLHTKSNTFPVGLGLRDDMFSRAFKFKRKVLDKLAGGPGKAAFMFLGDLNTMGMDYPFQKDISAEVELKKLDDGAKKVKMRRLTKNAPHTWWNGPGSTIPPSNLDHVVASNHLVFRQFGTADVDLRGWPALPPNQQGAWISSYSDHGLLYFEVQKL